MQALIFNESNIKLESLLYASVDHLRSYFISNDNAFSAVLIDENDHLSGDVRLIGDVVEIGYFSMVEKTVTISGLFDFNFYLTEEISDPVLLYQTNQNLIHIFNGGNDSDVPFPMPYSKEKTIFENEFTKLKEIKDLTVYSRQQIIDQGIG